MKFLLLALLATATFSQTTYTDAKDITGASGDVTLKAGTLAGNLTADYTLATGVTLKITWADAEQPEALSLTTFQGTVKVKSVSTISTAGEVGITALASANCVYAFSTPINADLPQGTYYFPAVANALTSTVTAAQETTVTGTAGTVTTGGAAAYNVDIDGTVTNNVATGTAYDFAGAQSGKVIKFTGIATIAGLVGSATGVFPIGGTAIPGVEQRWTAAGTATISSAPVAATFTSADDKCTFDFKKTGNAKATVAVAIAPSTAKITGEIQAEPGTKIPMDVNFTLVWVAGDAEISVKGKFTGFKGVTKTGFVGTVSAAATTYAAITFIGAAVVALAQF